MVVGGRVEWRGHDCDGRRCPNAVHEALQNEFVVHVVMKDGSGRRMEVNLPSGGGSDH
jgi:hypothetical protein